MASLYWEVFQQEPFVGTAMLPPELAFPELGITVKSAHNYYLDSLAWAGPLALIGILLLLGFVLAELLFSVVAPPRKEDEQFALVFHAAVPPALATLMISSVLRVPLREPYSGPIAFLLIGLVLAGGFRMRHGSALRRRAEDYLSI